MIVSSLKERLEERSPLSQSPGAGNPFVFRTRFTLVKVFFHQFNKAESICDRSKHRIGDTVVTASKDAVVVAWYVKPGQEIPAHIHPNGQDTWTVVTGRGEYYLDITGITKSIIVWDVVVAYTGCVHEVFNNGDEPLVFISVVSPADAGYQLVSLEDSLTVHP